MRKDQRKFCARKSKDIESINVNVLHSEDSLMHNKGRPSNGLFQLILK